MKTFMRSTVLTSIAILFILGGTTAAFADTNNYNNNYNNNTGQAISTTMVGGVLNLGSQYYSVRGGQVAFAMIAGQTVNPTTATIQYNFMASQDGLTTKGSANLNFAGTTTGGATVSVSGTFSISSNVPAAELPLGCSSNCQSVLPFFFVGTSTSVQVTIAGSTQTVPETLQIESPYFNPWGAPIVLASADNSIVIAATYTQGSIVWAGTKVGGAMFGTLGTSQTSGVFNMTSNEYENLVTGNAMDAGSISFSSMTPSSMNANGYYYGSSTIPTTNTSDCSAATGIPGTCTETGFTSTGKFSMGSISGGYTTTWGIPALGFSSSVTATMSQSGNYQR